MIYNCYACAFENNIKQICRELNKNEDEVLKSCQPNKEKYDPAYDFLNFKLPEVVFCKCWTSLR